MGAISQALMARRAKPARRNYFSHAHKPRITLARRWVVWKDLCAVDAGQIPIWEASRVRECGAKTESARAECKNPQDVDLDGVRSTNKWKWNEFELCKFVKSE
jgi:hypothetical protein